MFETSIITDLHDTKDASLFQQFIAMSGLVEIVGRKNAEEIRTWRKLLEGQYAEPWKPAAHLVLVYKIQNRHDEPEILAGALCEYYSKSYCGLIRYLGIQPDRTTRAFTDEKNLELVEHLIAEIYRFLERKAKEQGQKLLAILSPVEKHTPDLTPDQPKISWQKNAVLFRPGAQLVSEPHESPASKPTVNSNENHFMLLALPMPADPLSNGPLKISPEEISVFLNEFTGVDPEWNSDFKDLVRQLRNKPPRLQKVVGENSDIRFGRVSMAIHVFEEMADSSSYKARSCANFRSMELDILSRRFQLQEETEGTPPIASKVVTKAQVIIHFPYAWKYNSEGRSRWLIRDQRTLIARATLSFTEFRESHCRIWHLCLRPESDICSFSVFDLIKLTKIYGGLQEKPDITEAIFDTRAKEETQTVFWSESRNKWISVEELISEIVKVDEQIMISGLLRTLGATVQIDTRGSDLDRLKLGDFQTMLLARKGGEKDTGSKGEYEFEKNYHKFGVLMTALCGIVTEIFDFDRMSFGEMTDTLVPTVPECTELIRLQRGTLISVGCDDQIFAACWDNIGVSPYLVIPHAVLLHNEKLLAEAEEKVKSTLREGPDISKLEKLDKPRNHLKEAMNQARNALSEVMDTCKLEKLDNAKRNVEKAKEKVVKALTGVTGASGLKKLDKARGNLLIAEEQVSALRKVSDPSINKVEEARENLAKAEEEIRKALRKAAGASDLKKLEKARRDLERLLDQQLLPNVFNYYTERTIYEEGCIQSGFRERVEILRDRLKELSSRIEQKRNEREHLSNIAMMILLAFLTGFAFHPVLHDALDRLDPYELHQHYPLLLLALILFCVAAVLTHTQPGRRFISKLISWFDRD